MGARARTMVAGAIAAGLAAVLAAAGPAAAKGPTAVTITYPGSGGSVDLPTKDSDHASMGRLVEAFGLWSALQPDGGAGPLLTEPPTKGAADLGPAYDVVWSMVTESPDKPVMVSQTLYPEAPGGPLVHTEAGQPAAPYAPRTAGGWFRAPADLEPALAAAGFTWTPPNPAKAAAGTPAADPASGGDGTFPVAPAVLALTVVAAGAAGLAAARRRRRDAPAATG